MLCGTPYNPFIQFHVAWPLVCLAPLEWQLLGRGDTAGCLWSQKRKAVVWSGAIRESLGEFGPWSGFFSAKRCVTMER